MAFQQVKPQCVALLRHIQLSDKENLQSLPGLLDSLENTLKGVERPTSVHNGSSSSSPPSSLTSQEQQEHKKQSHQLANYVFFPFSQFLQVNSIQILRSSPTHQSVFDTFLRVLGTLIKTLEFEKAILEQLWTFVGLTLGGPLGSKTYERGWSDAIRKRLVEIWLIILVKVYNDDHPQELVLPGPIVAHTLNTILLILEDEDTELDTKIVCLQFLDSFIEHHLKEEDKVPQYLPGIVSTLAKVILAHRNNGGTIVAALEPLAHAIRASINETRCEALDLYELSASDPITQFTSLEALFAGAGSVHGSKNFEINDSQGSGLFSGPKVERSNITVSQVDKSSSPNQSEPGISKAWLKATASQLQRALLSILPVLRSHQNAEVRRALAELSYIQLEQCYRSLLASTSRLLFEELLICSKDDWDQVSETAARGLQNLLKKPDASLSGETTYQTLVNDIARDSITSLPHSIFTNGIANEATLHRQLNLIIATLELTHTLNTKQLQIERWSLNLLKAVEFAPIASGSSGPWDETSAWSRTDSSSLLLMDHIDQPAAKLIEPMHGENGGEQKQHIPPFPTLRLANIAPGSTTTLLQKAIQSFSKPTGLSDLLEHFLGIAGFADTGMPMGGTTTVASALWVVHHVLVGLAESQGKDLRDSCRRTLMEVPDIALSWLDRDDLEEMEEKIRPVDSQSRMEGLSAQSEADDLAPAELQSGEISMTGLLDESACRALAKPSRTIRQPSYELQVHCMCLRLLAVSAKVLERDYQKYMMHMFYPVLRALCPSSESRLGILQAHAYCALHQISIYMRYASPSQMLVDNVDYILNSISAHLRGTTTLSNGALDPLAPSVLVSVIELAGEDILPYLGDAVDEIFDALDRWHAYDLLVSELLRVLDRLVNICRVDEKTASTAVHGHGRAIEEVSKMQPDPEKDLRAFEDWFQSRHDDRLRFKSETERELPPQIDDLPDRNPDKPFKTLVSNEDEGPKGVQEEDGQAEMPTDQPEVEEKGPPLSKTQALVLAILRKSLYFLSHSSAFLRARVLALIASSIPILADRTSDFLPEIHRFWPYILARLDDGFDRSPAFVLVEVMHLLVTLMKYRGDFMNRRILKDVLPRLKTLVRKHDFKPPTKNQFTNEYRTLKAILELVTVALRDVPGVPGQDLWTIAILFRPFLSSFVDPDLRKDASALYETLAQLDPDLVWLILRSGLGEVEDMMTFVVTPWQTDEAEVRRLLDVI